MPKVQHIQNSLTTQAGRVALLLGIAAGEVPNEELVEAVTTDVQPRQRSKPVMVENIRFESITAGAHYLYFVGRKHKTISSDYYSKLKSLQARIRRLCNEDETEGYYWLD